MSTAVRFMLRQSGVSTPRLNSSKSLFHTTAPARALSPEHTKIVKSTAPVLAEHGVTITTLFYKRMLEAHPELKNTFNMAHQATGAQPAALAHSVWAYANYIDNLGALSSTVSRIAHKHASLGVTKEQYPIVGKYLLGAVKEVLGDAADQKVLEAWTAAYAQLADIFIGVEADLQNTAATASGGWHGWRRFTISRRVQESDEIISFYLTPKDGKALPTYKPGQFVSVRYFVPEMGVWQPRQYTLSDTPGNKYFRISVKKEFAREQKPAGTISTTLHEHVPEGAEVEVSPPFGDFVLDTTKNTPVVLLSGGVGLTPMMSMLNTIMAQSTPRPVVFIHAARNKKVHAMRQTLADVAKTHKDFKSIVYYEETSPSDVQGVDYNYKGRVDLSKIKDQAILPGADYYLCGPEPFIKAQREGLMSLGVSGGSIHSEVFGAPTF
ncbi:globin-like protein [Powellomyces hirtus]|nr:globin-like protein [Powellomyces hirtus]